MIKITTALRKEINAAVRANVNGAAPLAEVGLRGENWTPNALGHGPDDDLGDLVRLRDLTEIDEVAGFGNFAELDLYVTTGIGANQRELERNVCVLIRDGYVLGATGSGRNIPGLKARVGFPLTAEEREEGGAL